MSLRPRRILAGFLLSTTIGMVAYGRRSLSRSGIVGATITGTATFGFGGWSWGLSLIFFFLSSSVLSHFRAHDKEQVAADKFSKGGRRDIAQAMANGGMATLLSLAYGLTPSALARVRSLLEAGYVGALAAATADTWATELGVLSKQAPRLITTGKLTTPGTSGGVTLLGSGAGAAGALALGVWFAVTRWVERVVGERISHSPVGAGVDDEGWWGPLRSPVVGDSESFTDDSIITPRPPASVGRRSLLDGGQYAPNANRYPQQRATARVPAPHPLIPRPYGNAAPAVRIPFIAFIGGMAGALFDSLLGATVQVMYYCPRCGKETERRIHSCGMQTLRLRGVWWIDNDVVNFLATLMGSVVAVMVRVFWIIKD